MGKAYVDVSPEYFAALAAVDPKARRLAREEHPDKYMNYRSFYPCPLIDEPSVSMCKTVHCDTRKHCKVKGKATKNRV